MDKVIIDKIFDALARLCADGEKPEDAIRLDVVGGTKVAGLVVSKSFERLTSLERQDRIWTHLDTALSPHERTLVTFIVAETPAEHDELRERPAPVEHVLGHIRSLRMADERARTEGIATSLSQGSPDRKKLVEYIARQAQLLRKFGRDDDAKRVDAELGELESTT